MAKATPGNGGERADGEDGADDLAIIREQTRESLELLRSLVAMMLPKQADRDGPTLEDLIAALVAQQRDILVSIRRVEAELGGLSDRLGGASPSHANGGGRPTGVGRA